MYNNWQGEYSMKLGFREQEIFIDTKNYGRIKAEVSLKNKVGNGYLVTTTADNKIITGYLDLDFNFNSF